MISGNCQNWAEEIGERLLFVSGESEKWGSTLAGSDVRYWGAGPVSSLINQCKVPGSSIAIPLILWNVSFWCIGENVVTYDWTKSSF